MPEPRRPPTPGPRETSRWETFQCASIVLLTLSGTAVAVVWLWTWASAQLRLLTPHLGG